MTDIFFDYISNLIRDDIELDYEWKENNKKIEFRKKSSEGFDIIISYDQRYIYIETDRGYHDQFEIKMNIEETLIDVMGLVRDMLSKNMRIVEIRSNSTPRKWLLQSYHKGIWQTEHEVGLLIWNFLGKKNERIYFNNILLPRNIDG